MNVAKPKDGRQAGDLARRLAAVVAALAEKADFLSPERREALTRALADDRLVTAASGPVDSSPDESPAENILARKEREIAAVAERLAGALSEASGVPIDLTGYLANEAKSRLMLTLFEEADDDTLLSYFEERRGHGKLDADTLLAYAPLGPSRVFFAALAAAVDLKLDIEMVAAFIEDGGMRILERLLLRTELSEPSREAILRAYSDALPADRR